MYCSLMPLSHVWRAISHEQMLNSTQWAVMLAVLTLTHCTETQRVMCCSHAACDSYLQLTMCFKSATTRICMVWPWWLTQTRDLHRDGDHWNPVESAGIPRRWKLILWCSCGDGRICHGTPAGMEQNVRDSHGGVVVFDFVVCSVIVTYLLCFVIVCF